MLKATISSDLDGSNDSACMHILVGSLPISADMNSLGVIKATILNDVVEAASCWGQATTMRKRASEVTV